MRRDVVDQTADGEDGLVVPSSAVRNTAIYEVGARERAQQRSSAAFASNGTLESIKYHVDVSYGCFLLVFFNKSYIFFIIVYQCIKSITLCE